MYTRCCGEIWINDSCCIQEYGPEYRVNFCKLGGGEAEGEAEGEIRSTNCFSDCL